MRIVKFHPDNPSDYSCNVYWIVGDPRDPRDRNTLVDAGSSFPGNLAWMQQEMASYGKGIGRQAVEQVVITHWHYDHVGGLPELIRHFRPAVHAFQPGPGVDRQICDGSWLRLGGQDFRVIHTPGHSDDSICLFCPETRDLFTGDTLYRISDQNGHYPACYLHSLERLRSLGARKVYPGHGEPILEGVDAFIDEVLVNVQASVLQT